jgi:hypothetical protein
MRTRPKRVEYQCAIQSHDGVHLREFIACPATRQTNASARAHSIVFPVSQSRTVEKIGGSAPKDFTLHV